MVVADAEMTRRRKMMMSQRMAMVNMRMMGREGHRFR